MCFSLLQTILFSLDFINLARICSCNQPVLSNKGRVSLLKEMKKAFSGFELTTDKNPSVTSQMTGLWDQPCKNNCNLVMDMMINGGFVNKEHLSCHGNSETINKLSFKTVV